MVVQLSWLVVQRAVQGSWEYFVHVLCFLDQVDLAWGFSPDNLLWLERLQQSWLFRRSFHPRNSIEVDNLLIIDRSAQRSRLNEVAKVGSLSQLVDEGLWAGGILICTELIVVEEVLGACVVVNLLSRGHTRVLDILLVVLHYARHELKESVSDTNCVDLVIFFRVDQDPHKRVIYHFQIPMWPLLDTIGGLH